MQVYMLYYVSPDNFVPSPKLPISVFENLDDAIEAAGKQDGYGYGKDWFVKEVPLFSRRCKEVVENKSDETKDSPDPSPVKVRVGDQIYIGGSLFFVESYVQSMDESPSAYLKSVLEFTDEENRSK